MTSACVHCAEDLEEVIDGIEPTLCCENCCSEFQGRCGIYRGVSASCARKRYGCSKGDLKFLNFTTVIDAANRGAPIQLYLEAEVEYLGQLRDAHPMKSTQELIDLDLAETRIRRRREKAIQEKTEMIQRGLEGIPEETVAKRQAWLLGDYLSHPFDTETDLETVFRRLDLLHRESAIAERFRIDFDLARDYCKRFPPGSIESYEKWSDKTLKVFTLEGHRILSYLSEQDRKRLVGTPLEFALPLFEQMKASLDLPESGAKEAAIQIKLRHTVVFSDIDSYDDFWIETSDESEDDYKYFKHYTPTIDDDPEGVRRYVAYLRTCPTKSKKHRRSHRKGNYL